MAIEERRGRIINNEKQSRALAVRDVLLPKLLWGEIRVKEAEKFVKSRI